MTLAELIELRNRLDLSQTQMAEQLGLSLRAYQEIENGRAVFRRIHALAVERIALRFAAWSEHKAIADRTALMSKELAADVARASALVRTKK